MPRPRRSHTRTRTLAVATAALAASGAGATAALAAPAGVPTGVPAALAWAPTATRALHPAAGVPAGPLPAGYPLTVTLALRAHGTAALRRLISAEATPGNAAYQHYLTPAQFTARFAPSAAAAGAVARYLAGAGLRGVAVSANRLEVSATGTAATVERAFHTRLELFRTPGHTVYVNTAPAAVPAALAATVAAVLGLNDLPLTLPIVTHPAAGGPSLAGFTPPTFAKIYDASGTPTAHATSIAIMAEGDLSGVVADLRTEERLNHLPQVPVSIVRTGPASSDTSGADEWDLDSQTSTGIAGTVQRLYLYDASSLTDADLSHEINTFVAQDLAQAGSASLGECDVLPYLDGTMLAVDTSLEEAAVQGQSFFASSGDTGAACAVLPDNGVPDGGLPDTNYPASSTWTTAVGGTTLLASSDGTYQNEIAWNAGGGGVSALEFPGPWTANANPAYPAAGALLGMGRGVPDIAMDADPNTGADIIVNGKPLQVGGTSLSSPLALGAWARVQTAHANRLGNASLAFYRLYNAANPSVTSRVATPGFHDITLGTNGAYVATPGWDFTTGIGSLEVAALDRALG